MNRVLLQSILFDIGVTLFLVLGLYLGAGCVDVCPSGLAPIDVSLDHDLRLDAVPRTLQLGVIESSSGIIGYESSWVCSCQCDAPWATIWVGAYDDPWTPLELPLAMPVRDPYTGRDYLARVALEVTGAATGSTTCTMVLGGRQEWVFEIDTP